MLHRSLIAATIAVSGALGVSFVLAQAGGAGTSFAASKHKTTTVKKTTTSRKTTAASKKTSAASGTAQHADGTISAVSSDGLTITVTPDADKAGSNEYTGVTTIKLTGSTQYNAGHGATPTATKPTITTGEYIIAEGTVSSDGKTLTATLVSVGAHGGSKGGHGGGGPHADGTISAISSDGLTLTVTPDADPAGSTEYTKVTTIVLTSSTQYDAGHGAAPTTTKPTITTGEYIVAEGTLSSDGTTLTATSADIGTKGAGGH
jgi:hypothetical protein